ncbi:GFA family protein [Zestomonas carbonaria]|uniref:Glutathione-dependent formaldehyde-activating enzyme n=1 Tax=Zestomonas carbonaria TaxID=2762745 RepID=A0A7U7EJA3_9GAMM|nr:GFA family protein [Pseudomonas carbonaria]CAD5105901.1 Putative glutathione-dependent formaldehyde-activating enzyme [Pseudomonas carbonaria]
MTDILRGSCLCDRVQYQLTMRPKALSHCHCTQCRKGHGSAFASYGSVPRSHLSVRGAEHLASFRSSATVARQFCSHCGSSLFWSNSAGEYADWVSIALGTLDSDFPASKQKHLHVASKAAWYEIHDAWPQRP